MKQSKKTRQIRQRDSRERDLIYGFHSASAALQNGAREIHSVWTSRNMAERLGDKLAARGLEAHIVHPREIDKRLGPDTVHQGVLIEATPLPQPDLECIGPDGLIVMLDQVTDPHNVGAIMRSCAAFGVKALVMTARHSPDASAVLAKSASGALEHVPMIKVTNLARAMEHLKDAGYCLVGLDSAAPHKINEISTPGPYALVLGAEGKGLRQLTCKNCDVMARLPLPGILTSLNVSNAAALALYTLTAQ